MRSELSSSQDGLNNWLLGLGFDQTVRENTVDIFLNKNKDICLITDTVISTLADYPYVAYTSRQNDLMATPKFSGGRWIQGLSMVPKWDAGSGAPHP